MIDLLGYVAFFLTTALIFALISLGLNLQWGLTGLFNVGVAGFVAIGAYTSALMTTPDDPVRFGGQIRIRGGHIVVAEPFVALGAHSAARVQPGPRRSTGGGVAEVVVRPCPTLFGLRLVGRGLIEDGHDVAGPLLRQ